MTLVLTALTQHEVIQVSDRRFTYMRGDEVLRRDDENNKAILFCGRLMFSFTGFGDLGTERQTDLWLANRICDVIAEATQPGDQGAVLQGVAAKATELFRKLRYRGQRHAFIGAGWARFNPDQPQAPASPNEMQPYLALISNFHDGSRELSTASTEFSLFVRVLGSDEKVLVFDAPQHLSSIETQELANELAAADGAPSAMVNALAGRVRIVAARDPGVGAGLMINSLARSALGSPAGFMALASEPLADAQTFLYVPPSGDTAIQLGPVATCGRGVISGFRSEPIPPDTEPPTRPGPTLLGDPPGLVRRWYLVPVAGSGTNDDPYRAETLGHGGSALIPSHPEGHPRHGHPKHDVALVLVSSDDHGPLEADPRIYPVADLIELDLPVDELDANKRGWIDGVTEVRQVAGDGLVRDVVRRLGQQLEPDFNEESYWVK
jgi:hypothetical protein